MTNRELLRAPRVIDGKTYFASSATADMSAVMASINASK